MKSTFLLFLFFLFITTQTSIAQKNKKDNGKTKTPVSTNYSSEDAIPDSATKFTGIIKYRMTTDDPSERDSMFIIYGENKIRFTMFMPGYKPNEVFETNMIADFNDSILILLDVRKKNYSIEQLGSRNAGVEFALSNFKKKGLVLQTPCNEYSGEMKTKNGEIFQVSTLVSNKHTIMNIKDYNFLNIQPAILGYKIVLAFKSHSVNKENTMIVAYKIEPGDTERFFDLSEFRQK